MVNGQTRSKFYSSVSFTALHKYTVMAYSAFLKVRFIQDQVHGVTGSGVGAYIIVPGTGYETSSGGPFFRGERRPGLSEYNVKDFAFLDIDNQGGDQQEVYFYMNSGHEQSMFHSSTKRVAWLNDLLLIAESYRTGFFGPYALAITSGSAPSGNLDISFFDNLGLQGYVPASGRGTVRGSYSGTLSGLPITIGFKVLICCIPAYG